MEISLSLKEQLSIAVAALVAILVSETISQLALQGSAVWFVAPMGASAVLLFAVSSGPMAQPWPVFLGNLVSGLTGVIVAHQLGANGISAAFALGLALLLMFQLRCLHPPGGAIAVSAVLGGPVIYQMGVTYVLGPVLLNTLLMILLAMLLHKALGRHYPHRHPPRSNTHQTNDAMPSRRGGISHQDLAAVLAERAEVLDITEDDLEDIVHQATLRAAARGLTGLTCREIMSKDLITVHEAASADVAWEKLATHHVKLLPVIDDQQQLKGIISVHDFFIQPSQQPRRIDPAQFVDYPVSAFMKPQVMAIDADQPLMSIARLFSDAGMHQLPVIDDQHRVIGMLTQSDYVAALIKRLADTPNLS